VDDRDLRASALAQQALLGAHDVGKQSGTGRRLAAARP